MFALGFQGWPLEAGENRTLPSNTPTMAERLKSLGYSTHLVGKWHLGSAYRNVTPTLRGFDSHYGYWNGYVGYFNYISTSSLFQVINYGKWLVKNKLLLF